MSAPIKKYRLLQPIVLGFMDHRDQWDERVKPREDRTIECDGQTIWLVDNDGRHESTTRANLLEVCADLFEEITEDAP
jgi:hypothetical protein